SLRLTYSLTLVHRRCYTSICRPGPRPPRYLGLHGSAEQRPTGRAPETNRPRECMLSEYQDIKFEVEDGVAWVTINRPEVRNAFRERTLDELCDALGSTRNDPSIAVAVITGEGDVA